MSEKETVGEQTDIPVMNSGMQVISSLRFFFAKNIPRSSSSLHEVSWLLVATGLAGGFNYLANVLVGKLLGPEEYGIYAALLAFSLILSAPTGVIQTVVAGFSARSAATSSQLDRLGVLLASTRRILIPWGIGGVLVIALASGLIAGFLHIPSPGPVIVLAFTLLPAVLLPVALGALQGLQRFGRYGWGQISAAALRLCLGVGFILLGWGVSGALLGGVLAGMGAYLLGWWWLRDVRASGIGLESGKSEQPGIGAEVSHFTLIVALSLLAFMVLTYIDTVAVKSRFLPLEAGLYSAVATIGRVVLYASTAVATIMYPRVAGEHARGNPTAALAWRALLVTTGLSCLGVLAFSVRPQLVMQLLFGEQFLGKAALLVPYSIAMLLLAAVDVWMLYFLAVQEIRYTIFLLVGSILLVAVLFALPLSLTGVVWAMMFCNAALVLAGGLLLWRRSG